MMATFVFMADKKCFKFHVQPKLAHIVFGCNKLNFHGCRSGLLTEIRNILSGCMGGRIMGISNPINNLDHGDQQPNQRPI